MAVSQKVLPTQEECVRIGIQPSYYQNDRINPIDRLHINEIIWDLIAERIVTPGCDANNQEWPFIRLTDFGKTIAEDQTHSYYDPDGYILRLKSLVPAVDSTICQYIAEGLNCFRQRLYFASAVMCGAAAEKAILLLLAGIAGHECAEKNRKEILALLELPNLPKIFDVIQKAITTLENQKTIPYSVHQGCSEHLLSLFEMIRAHRNEAVHPKVGNVSKEKIYLTIQTLPAALSSLYRLIAWFSGEDLPVE